MAGKSPVTADAEQRSALVALSHSRDRGEADRARAILLTLSGWTSRQIAEAFGVREDTVRFWRSEEHTSELQSLRHLVCRLLLEKKKKKNNRYEQLRNSYIHSKTNLCIHIQLHSTCSELTYLP